MKLIYKSLFLLYCLLLSCSSKSQNKNSIYPKESFSVIQSKLSNGKPIIGSVNMAYKNYDKKNLYPWCLEINVALNLDGVYKNGLPDKSESMIADNFEDELVNDLKKVSTVHYIGHMYDDSFLDIYIYLDDPEHANNYLKQEVNRKGIARHFSYKISKDAKWTTVQPFFK